MPPLLPLKSSSAARHRIRIDALVEQALPFVPANSELFGQVVTLAQGRVRRFGHG